MIGLACRIALAAVLSLLVNSGAFAHPHVFVRAKGEFVYGSNGALKEIRYAWSFDEMFSSFAAQGLDTNKDGKLSREELQPLAKENVDSLKEFAYFTVTAGGRKALEFGEPSDYWFDTDNKTTLTLHFTLPVKNAPKGSIAIEIYDPTYFVAFSLASGKPVSLIGAPKGCRVEAAGADASTANNPSEAFFQQLQAGADYGAQFANRINVHCP
ncbi:MAG TPA: DUF1007 family protein [Xanthobacteraceae bacterium]|nr:DUF1007 family protein [Xanthobacteraceae bacterium]